MSLPFDFSKSVLLAATILSCTGLITRADEANWVDLYFDGHGACEQQPMIYQPQPLGLPVREWTDDDLAKLKSAIERCEAKFEKERHIPLNWGRAIYDTVVSDVQDMRQYDAQEKARFEASKIEARQVAVAKQHQADSDRAAFEDQELERNARADAEIANKKAADTRNAQALSASQERDRVREEARLAGVREQAQRDRDTADRTRRLLEQEAPIVRAVEKEASEARQARIEAEKHLEELRQQVTAAQQKRSAENMSVQVAKEARLEINRKVELSERERREFDALAKACSVSADQVGRIALGMSLREVRQVFGCVGSLNTTTEIAGVGAFSVFQWDGHKGGTAALTTFNNDRLVTKSQTALD